MAVTVAETTVADPAVRRLLEAHARHCTEASPPESCHFMPADALDDPSITLWAARTEDGQLIGVGALKALPDAAGEVKSMHTAALRRGLGAGSAILAVIEKEARTRGYTDLWLETGTMAEFIAARGLYERHGFTPCPPFGDYQPDPNSAFYTKALSRPETAR